MKPYEMPEIQAKLAIIKDAVLSAAPDAEAIYLFGSYAYGTPHEDSDLDICVVLSDSDTRRPIIAEMAMCKELRNKLHFPLDLMSHHSSDFKSYANQRDFYKTIASEGVRIYG